MKIKLVAVAVLVVIAGAGFLVYKHDKKTPLAAASTQNTAQTAKTANTADIPKTINYCADNASGQMVIVSLSKQHMWSCEGTKKVYDNAVITGKLQNDDSTPLGSYKIYSKLINQTLKGCDPSGCWNDPVSYWLPYQEASGGTIGFHDADWRQPSDFGNIAPSSNQGSHGCVEMPVAAAKWLYNWSAIGTAVTIES